MPDLTDNLTHIERINGPLPALPIKDDAMSPEQFADLKQTLVTLLTPGYELSKIALAQVQARQAEAAAQDEPPHENEFIEGERKADQQDTPKSAPGPIAPQTDPAT